MVGCFVSGSLVDQVVATRLTFCSLIRYEGMEFASRLTRTCSIMTVLACLSSYFLITYNLQVLLVSTEFSSMSCCGGGGWAA